MQIKEIEERISVSPEIAMSDIAAIKAAGFVAVMNNRPDGEEPDQPAGGDSGRVGFADQPTVAE